jgi:hypothetical protein
MLQTNRSAVLLSAPNLASSFAEWIGSTSITLSQQNLGQTLAIKKSCKSSTFKPVQILWVDWRYSLCPKHYLGLKWATTDWNLKSKSSIDNDQFKSLPRLIDIDLRRDTPKLQGLGYQKKKTHIQINCTCYICIHYTN